MCDSAPSCGGPIGLQSKRIKNSDMKATSQFNNYFAHDGRLHGPRGWVAKYRNYYQWLEVDMKRPMKITKITTQGRANADQWITAYQIGYSQIGYRFVLYQDVYGNIKVSTEN